jgi:hypothetical protein
VKLLAAMTTALALLSVGWLGALPATAAPRGPKPGKCSKAHRGPVGKGRYRSATIYEVADSALPSGSKVRLSAVVTAVAASSQTAWLGTMPADPGYLGPEYSGLEIDLSGLSPPPALAVGDRVSSYGTAVWDAAGNWLDLADLTVESAGESVSPLEVSDAMLLSPSEPAALDAVLVRVPNLTLATESSSEFTMTDGLALGSAIIGELPTIYGEPTQFPWVTGIADTLGPVPRLLPRTVGDLHLAD